MRFVLSGGNINICALAKNAGTSVDQIERFYARRLPLSKELLKNLYSFGANTPEQLDGFVSAPECCVDLTANQSIYGVLKSLRVSSAQFVLSLVQMRFPLRSYVQPDT
jgi:hypothetical protein